MMCSLVISRCEHAVCVCEGDVAYSVPSGGLELFFQVLVVHIQFTLALLHTQWSRAVGAGLLGHGLEHGERRGVDTARVLHSDDDVVGSSGSFHQ